MFRIDNSTSVVSAPVVPAAATPGYFTNGNPVSGLPATIVDDWWLNTVQEEITTVIVNAGLALNKNDRTQLWQAINGLITANESGPDYDPFLPLVGGQLYNPGGSDPLSIFTDAGRTARIRYVSGTSHAFYAGVNTDGRFHIYDAFRNKIAFEVLQDVANSIHIYTPLTVSNDTIVTGGLSTQQSFSASLNISAGGNISANGTISAVGSISTAGDISTGTGRRVYAWDLMAAGGVYIGSRSLGFIDSGNANNQLSTNGGLFISGLLTAGTLAAGGTTISGPLNVSGAVNLSSSLAVGGSGTFNGAVGFGSTLQLNGDGTFLGANNHFTGAMNVDGQLFAGGLNSQGVNVTGPGIQNFGNYALVGATSMMYMTGGGGRPWAIRGLSDWFRVQECNTASPPTPIADWFAVTSGAIHVLSGGTAYKAGGGLWVDNSERRLKRNIQDYTTGLDTIRQLRPRSYEFNGEGGTKNNGKRHVGLVYEEAEDLMPEMLGTFERPLDDDAGGSETLKTIDATAVIYALVNSVRELSQRLEKLGG